MMAGDGHTDADDPVLLRAAEAGGEFAAMCVELIERRQEPAGVGHRGLATDSVDVEAHATELASVMFGREGGPTRRR